MQIIPFTVSDGSNTGQQVTSYMIFNGSKIVKVLPYFLFTNRSPQGVAELLQLELDKLTPKSKDKKHNSVQL